MIIRKHKIIEIRHLTDSTFVLRMERNGLDFQSGQFILLGRADMKQQREYSIYSGEDEPFLEVLVRETGVGKVSRKLKQLKPGDLVEVDGPFGFFRLSPEMCSGGSFLFVATGTGISPFHSFVKTWPGLDYKFVHGVRYQHENYEHTDFDKGKVVLCTSGDNGGDFAGRVTDFIIAQKIDPQTNCFLCGNSEMIHEVFDILTGKGIPVSNIWSEVYF